MSVVAFAFNHDSLSVSLIYANENISELEVAFPL